MFDRERAVRTWRGAVLSRGGLTTDDVDELQDHLERVESDLRDRLDPEEAFWVAAHRVGTPDALTREYQKVRPNAGWLLRAQWALLGLLAYWLFVSAAQVVVHLLVVAAAYAGLDAIAAVGRLYAYPLAIVLAVATAVLVVRRFAPSPEAFERALLMAGSPPRPTLLLAVLLVAVWQRATALVMAMAIEHANRLIGSPGAPAPLPSGAWSVIASVVGYLLPVATLVLVVHLQRQRQREVPTTR